MARFDMTDREWSFIQPLLPNKVRGVARVDDRRVINGILWRWRTGTPWQIFPSATDHIRPATTASSGGVRRAFGTGYYKLYQELMTAISR